ncbi:hypothetical protein M0805_009389 [Coniferiporia weirii]|nr:hypothetical protein M0805_009389 [Coniferiporia weirii]
MVRIAQRLGIWIKSMYLRITLTKSILAFFLFNFAHCFAHAIVQSFLFSLDWDASALTSAVVSTAGVPENELAWLVRQPNITLHDTMYTLRLCDDIPLEKSAEYGSCSVIFQSDSSGFQLGQSSILVPIHAQPHNHSSNPELADHLVQSIGAFLRPVPDVASGSLFGVDLTMAGVNGGRTTFLSAQCTRVALYADQVLKNSRIEELALIGSEFWLLGISVFAIMYGSIPHLFAALAFRILSTGWSAYSIWRTHDIGRRFDVLLVQGACGVDLFPGYFRTRIAIQIADLVLNVVALLLLAWLVSRIVRSYTTFMFQWVGPPDHVVKTYRLLLGLLTCLQLLVFVLVTSASLWVDQLITGAIAAISSHTTVYIALFVFTIALLLPWLAVGWRSLCREQPRVFLAFLGIAIALEAGWSGMYDSLVWRWTWIQWPFFASLAVAAQLLLLASIVLGVLCRMNFGKGLKEYLHVASVLEKDDFEPEMFDRKRNSSSSISKEDWMLDIEKQGDKDRLSQALDFGAHQPSPPMSPPPYEARAPVNIPAPSRAVVEPTSRVYMLSRAAPLDQRSSVRPQSFSAVLPALPTLGKNDPWEFATDQDEDGFDRPRL